MHKKIRSIVIEDEVLVRQGIVHQLNKHSDIDILGEAGSVADAEVLVHACKPDLIFLDIQLTDGTGFDLLQKLAHPPQVIFITAHADFALQAIKAGALDYLLKPLDEEELNAAIQKVRQSKMNLQKDHLQNAQDYLNGIKEKMVLRTNDGAYLVWFHEIVYCKSDGPYTYFMLSDGRKIIVSKTMKEYELVLPEANFIRCHHSFIVNIKEIIKLDKQDQIVLRNKELIPVSNRKKEMVLAALA
jgi:two-component system, LytTR family, response regulator